MKSIALGAIALVTATGVVTAQQAPPVRQLGPVVATASEQFGPQVFVRHVKNGVLVNDPANRRLLMFDASLARFSVVADTTPATASAYSGRSAGLIAYKGDSSLFVDAQSMSMLVVDPEGKVARVMSVPRSQDAMALGNTQIGAPGFDGQGRLVYRGMPRFQMRGGPGGGAARGSDGPPQMPEMPDTAPVVRVDLATRVVDTIGYTKVPRPRMDVQRDEATGRMSMTMQVNPLPIIDDFAVLSDGSVAFVRGRDYHIDWVRPDGSRSSSPKMPFDWQRLTDEDKVAFIDSLKAARERQLAANPQPAPAPAAASTTTTAPGGERREMIMIGGGPGGGGGGGGGPGQMGMNNRNVNFVPPNELPDYKPAFFAGNTRADADGNLWIQTIPTKATARGPVYDVINTNGALFDRVQVPRDRTIVGFGSGGVVYLAVRDGNKTKLERATSK